MKISRRFIPRHSQSIPKNEKEHSLRSPQCSINSHIGTLRQSILITRPITQPQTRRNIHPITTHHTHDNRRNNPNPTPRTCIFRINTPLDTPGRTFLHLHQRFPLLFRFLLFDPLFNGLLDGVFFLFLFLLLLFFFFTAELVEETGKVAAARDEFIVGSLLDDFALLHTEDAVCAGENVQLVSDEDTGFPRHETTDTFFEQSSSDVGVYRGERVVQKNNVCVIVRCSSDIDTSFLTARDSDATFPNFSRIAVGEHFEIGFEGTGTDHRLILFRIKFSTKQDIILDRSVLNPCCLRTKSHSSTEFDDPFNSSHFAHQGREKGTFPSSNFAYDDDEFAAFDAEGDVFETLEFVWVGS